MGSREKHNLLSSRLYVHVKEKAQGIGGRFEELGTGGNKTKT
jgi:hypothetical protein